MTSGTSVRENYVTSYKLFREDYEPMPFNHCYDIGYYIPEQHSYSMKCFFCALYVGKADFEQKCERRQVLSTDNTFEVCAFGHGGWMEQALVRKLLILRPGRLWPEGPARPRKKQQGGQSS